MRFGVCASYWDVTRLDQISFDYLEESVQEFLVPERPEGDFEENLRQAQRLSVPIEVANALLPPTLVLIATPTRPVDTVRLERYIKAVLARAERTGIRVIVFGSGTARAYPPGHDRSDATKQMGEHLARWSEWGRDHGVQFALEPLRYQETNILNTVIEGGELVAGIADSGAGLAADIYHMVCNGESPGDLSSVGPLLAHVHVAEKQERAAPGRYGEDLRPYLLALHETGYDRRISIECHWEDFPAEVAPAMATARQQWADTTHW